MTIADRTVRAGSQQTRREILLAASRLFVLRGYAGVSVHQVAKDADVFPNQVTYHFGSKDGLFVEVAGGLILEAGQVAERAAQSARSARDYHEDFTNSILGEGLPAVLVFVEATLIARRRTDLAPRIRETLERLYEHGPRTEEQRQVQTKPENFWATMMGAALQMVDTGATGTRANDHGAGLMAQSSEK